MEISIIKGRLESQDVIEILEQLVKIRLDFLEKKIGIDQEVEDIRCRERSIREIQATLSEARKTLRQTGSHKNITCSISWND